MTEPREAETQAATEDGFQLSQQDLQTLAARMRESYNANAGSWWSTTGGAPTVDFDPEQPPPGRRHTP